MDRELVKGMTKAGRLAAKVLNHVCSYAAAGVTTNELDRIAHDFTISNGGTNACLGYRGYPKSICTSVNEVLCHGVPNDTPLKVGDIVNIDVTVKVGPWHGDTSRTVIIGAHSKEAAQIVDVAYRAMLAGISVVRPRCRTGDIGYATETYVKSLGLDLSVCKEIGGHGIGKIFHDAPYIPSFGQFGHGEVVRPWRCITVEPIILYKIDSFMQYPIDPLEGYDKCEVTEIRAASGLAAQFEHTVLVTDSGYEILTVES